MMAGSKLRLKIALAAGKNKHNKNAPDQPEGGRLNPVQINYTPIE